MENFKTKNQDKSNLVGESILDKLTKAREHFKCLGMRNTAGLNSAENLLLSKEYERAAQRVSSLEMSYRVDMLDVNADAKVMSDAVDVEQERLRLIDENDNLKERLCDANAEISRLMNLLYMGEK